MNIQDFLQIENKRKVLLANKVSVGNTALRNLNLYKNVDVLDVKVLKISDIARELVISFDAYEGCQERTILDTESSYKYMERAIIREDLESFPRKLLTDSTVSEIYKCANELRLNELTDEWTNSKDKKIIDLNKIINSYEELVREDACLDEAMLVIEAGRIAKEKSELMSILLPWLNKSIIGNLETNVLSQAEINFIKLIAGDNYSEIEFLNDDISNDGKVTYSFYKAYGIANEINHVVEAIRDKHPGLCALYYSEPSYVNFIKAAMENANIPYKLTGGNPATGTDLMQFILALLDTAGNNFLYKNLKSVVGNRLITFYNVANDEVFLNPISGYNEASGHGIGWGYDRYLKFIDYTRKDCERLEKDPEATDYDRQYIPLRKEFALFLERFIGIFLLQEDGEIKIKNIVDMFNSLVDFTYLYTYKTNQDKIKLKKPLIEISKKLSLVDDDSFSNLNERIEYIKNMLIKLSFDDDGENNGVIVAPITGFMTIDRPQVYVIGLSAKSFSIDTKQSPVLLDDEKKKYIVCASEDNTLSSIDLSSYRNPRRKLEMENSFKTIDHGNVSLIYSYYDTISLRESSPSVFFLDMLSDNEILLAKGYVEDDFLKNNISNATGSINISADELKSALEASNEKIQANKAAKAQKKEERQKTWEENRKAYYDVEGGKREPSFEDDGEGNEELVKEIENNSEDEEKERDVAKEESSEKKALYISSSGIQTLLSCPIAYYYNYTKHLKFYEELENTGYVWLNPAAKGNLCHRVMEKYMSAAFPPAVSLSGSIDFNLFESIFNEEVVLIEEELPPPSEAIKKREISFYKEMIQKYLIRVHNEWVQDSNKGKAYQVIGCELKFNSLKYEYQKEDGYDFSFMLTGSIDRVDGYVDENNILQLRIIDYKTGKKDTKNEEVNAGVQIQHYIYGIAALDYIKNYLDRNDYIFAGKKVKDIDFEMIAYLFPYEDPNENDEYGILDVTGQTMSCFEYDTNGRKLDGKLMLPDSVNEILSRTIGAMQNDNLTDLAVNSEAIINEKIEKAVATIRAEKFEAEKEKAQKAFDKSILLGTNKTSTFAFKPEDIEVDYGLKEFCDGNYCDYRNICRKWMGGNEQ